MAMLIDSIPNVFTQQMTFVSTRESQDLGFHLFNLEIIFDSILREMLSLDSGPLTWQRSTNVSVYKAPGVWKVSRDPCLDVGVSPSQVLLSADGSETCLRKEGRPPPEHAVCK